MFKRMLVPLDGSNLAETVLPLASYLADRFQATLVLFHVVEKAPPTVVHGEHHLQTTAEAKAYLEKVARQWSSDRVSIQQNVHEVQKAGVAQTISGHVGELHVDMIALCAHGHGGLRDALFGSIALQVIREVTVPVVFIRPDHIKDQRTPSVQRVLLPLDGSEAHEIAIPVAVSVAAKCSAEIRLLTVVPTTQTLPVKEAIASRVSPRATALTLDISAQQAEEYLHRISADLSAQGLAVSEQVSRGDALSKLTETITGENADLVVMATHGHSALDAHWEGSLTPQFLPKTPVPVILVRGIGENNS